MADLKVANSTYQTGAQDTATSMVNSVDSIDAQQWNGVATAAVQVESTLGNGTSLVGGFVDLVSRLANFLTGGKLKDFSSTTKVTFPPTIQEGCTGVTSLVPNRVIMGPASAGGAVVTQPTPGANTILHSVNGDTTVYAKLDPLDINQTTGTRYRMPGADIGWYATPEPDGAIVANGGGSKVVIARKDALSYVTSSAGDIFTLAADDASHLTLSTPVKGDLVQFFSGFQGTRFTSGLTVDSTSGRVCNWPNNPVILAQQVNGQQCLELIRKTDTAPAGFLIRVFNSGYTAAIATLDVLGQWVATTFTAGSSVMGTNGISTPSITATNSGTIGGVSLTANGITATAASSIGGVSLGSNAVTASAASSVGGVTLSDSNVTADIVNATSSTIGGVSIASNAVTATNTSSISGVSLSFGSITASGNGTIGGVSLSSNAITATGASAVGGVTLSGSLITSSSVGTTALRTASGLATVSVPVSPGTVSANITLNDYSFFPSFTVDSSLADGNATWSALGRVVDPSNTIGRVQVTANSNDPGGGFVTATLRWRYMTASDNPHIYVLINPATGLIVGGWNSDDPITVTDESYEDDPDAPGLIRLIRKTRIIHEVITSPGLVTKNIPLSTLTQIAIPQRIFDSADRHIERQKLNPEHRLYRALEFLTQKEAPSTWIGKNCTWDLQGNVIRELTITEKGARATKGAPPKSL